MYYIAIIIVMHKNMLIALYTYLLMMHYSNHNKLLSIF